MIKFIKNFLKKKLGYGYKRNYYFYRWLVTFFEDKTLNKIVMESIGDWMSKSFPQPLPFFDIFLINHNIYVYTRKPAAWIGKNGCIMANCLQRLNYDKQGNKVHNYYLRVVEMDKDNSNTIISNYINSKKKKINNAVQDKPIQNPT